MDEVLLINGRGQTKQKEKGEDQGGKRVAPYRYHASHQQNNSTHPDSSASFSSAWT